MQSPKDGQLWWFDGGTPKTIYGAKALENIIQFLARIVIFEAAMRVREMTDNLFVHQVHDELVYIIEDDKVEMFKRYLRYELRKPPPWLCDPVVPLDCDIGSGQSYGDCK